MKVFLLFSFVSLSSAFTLSPSTPAASTSLNAEPISRKNFLQVGAGAALAFGLVPNANANRDYENVGFLGGGSQVDVNNANVRVYLKMPGMYPGAAGKIVTNGPYSSVSDIYNIPGLTSKEKEVIKKYESRFVAFKPSPDYVVDRVNNGLYK